MSSLAHTCCELQSVSEVAQTDDEAQELQVKTPWKIRSVLYPPLGNFSPLCVDKRKKEKQQLNLKNLQSSKCKRELHTAPQISCDPPR